MELKSQQNDKKSMESIIGEAWTGDVKKQLMMTSKMLSKLLAFVLIAKEFDLLLID